MLGKCISLTISVTVTSGICDSAGVSVTVSVTVLRSVVITAGVSLSDGLLFSLGGSVSFFCSLISSDMFCVVLFTVSEKQRSLLMLL